MSPEPRDPHDPPASPPPPEHEPHGVVETLREELHEAVAHVPKPVRWTVGKLVRVALISLVLLVVVLVVSALLYLTNRTEVVARELTLVLNHTLAQHSDLVLSIADVKGNPLTGFRLLRPRVRFRADDAPLLEADEMRASYSAIDLLRGGHSPLILTITRPIVHLDGGPGHTWRIPAWAGGGKSPGRGAARHFRLAIVDAEVFAPRPLGVMRGVEVKVSGETGAATHVVVEGLRWREGPWHSRLDQLAAELTSDADSVRFRVRELRTGDLTLRLNGAWRAGSHEQRVHAEIDRIRWRWLAEVFDNEEFDVPGEGRLRVDARHAQRWLGSYTADVSWDSLALVGGGRFDWDGKHLALDSLAAKSLAGEFEGRLWWSKQGWTLMGDAQHADPAHWHALRLDGWPAGQLNGSFKYVLDSRGKKNTSRLDVHLLGSQWAGWDMDSARVRVEFPAFVSDSFAVLAWRRGGRFTLAADVGRTGWSGSYTLQDFPLEAWPDGRASGLRGTLARGEGRVEARAGNLFVTGDLAGATTDWSAAHFARWQLKGIAGRLLPTPDLTAMAYAQDGFFVGVHLDSADATMHLGNQNVTFTPLHASAGDTLLTASGQADWVAAHWHVLMNSATAASSQFAWTAEPPLEFSGDAQGTVFERVRARDGDAEFEARGRWAAPGGAYDFAMSAQALDMARIGLPHELGLAGRAAAHLEVTGLAGDPRWTFDGRASNPGFGGHHCDTLSLSLGGRQHTLEVRALRYGLGTGTANLEGTVERTVHAWPDSLTPTAVVRWLQDAGSWHGQLRAQHLAVDHLGALAPAAAGWQGTLDGSVDVSGSPPSPRFELAGTAERLGWRDYVAQHVELHASYGDGQLDVPRLLVTMQDVVSTIHGRLPVKLAVGRLPEVPDAAMSWNVDVPRGDLELLPALVPLIQSASGRFDLNMVVAGTTRHPKLSGKAHIRDGTVRPAGRDELLESVYADLQFDESRVLLDTLSAKQGRTGRAWSRGTADLAGFDVKRYQFDLHLRDFASSQEGLYGALFDGDFTVTDGPPVHGERLPQVTGNVDMQRGVIEFDFANQSEVQKRAATTEPLYWTYRIHLAASSNLHWRPPDGDIEFDADLDLEQTPDSLLIYGEMHLIKGHYFFLSNRFTLTQADLSFDNLRGVDPTLEIVAETRLKPSQRSLTQGSALDVRQAPTEVITATMTGRSSDPRILLSSSSNWDQREILGELTFGRITGEGVSVTDPVQSYLTRQISNQLSRDLSKYFNDGINRWEVSREQEGALLNGQGGVLMSVGGDINARTSWLVTQRLPGLDNPMTNPSGGGTVSYLDRDVQVEYRINRFIYATTELVQRRVGPATSAQSNVTDFNVNLKARWEY